MGLQWAIPYWASFFNTFILINVYQMFIVVMKDFYVK